MLSQIEPDVFGVDVLGTLLVWHSPGDALELLVKAWRQQGYDVRSCYSFEDAWDFTQALTLDLVLINLNAAKEKGYWFCKKLQQPNGQLTSVVFSSSNDDQRTIAKAFESGVTDYLVMPFDVSSCLLRLKKHLQTGRLLRRLRCNNRQLRHQVSDSEEKLQRLESIQSALVCKNQELEKLAYLDGLTQINNRRSFDQRLENAWGEQRRCSEQSLSLILCDIDYFKQYNDIYGHPAGDQCLQQVAQIIRQTAQRSSDIIARYGGEEFVVMLKATDHKGGCQVARYLHAAINKAAIPHRGSHLDRVTLSMGIAMADPDHHHGVGDLIESADRALYQAKRQGRNCIVLAKTPMESASSWTPLMADSRCTAPAICG
ncbi:GGDEF domain-containing response regulator [Leptothoe kymatousa]|uniref:Diguanylate cyclase n=1 Tax=Leptothoe kymatousa TAU-MAC 1615 TaxID=2364775 RepID=A0ABS5Y2H1_9CYAN|nr:diguanylate cyclase [Leptothoe kymatousa]MBT9312035.1 diguanylate cyclase [Leptothoe kymatousa TAU-MAC 1615]